MKEWDNRKNKLEKLIQASELTNQNKETIDHMKESLFIAINHFNQVKSFKDKEQSKLDKYS